MRFFFSYSYTHIPCGCALVPSFYFHLRQSGRNSYAIVLADLQRETSKQKTFFQICNSVFFFFCCWLLRWFGSWIALNCLVLFCISSSLSRSRFKIYFECTLRLLNKLALCEHKLDTIKRATKCKKIVNSFGQKLLVFQFDCKYVNCW